jgi:hypothetical protein
MKVLHMKTPFEVLGESRQGVQGVGQVAENRGCGDYVEVFDSEYAPSGANVHNPVNEATVHGRQPPVGIQGFGPDIRRNHSPVKKEVVINRAKQSVISVCG